MSFLRFGSVLAKGRFRRRLKNKMNMARGLNRAWVLFTSIWFFGVIVKILSDFQAEKACGEAVTSALSLHKGRDALNYIPEGCSAFDNLQTDNYFLYGLHLVSPYAWTVTIPVGVWLLGFGIWWVARGFRGA